VHQLLLLQLLSWLSLRHSTNSPRIKAPTSTNRCAAAYTACCTLASARPEWLRSADLCLHRSRSTVWPATGSLRSVSARKPSRMMLLIRDYCVRRHAEPLQLNMSCKACTGSTIAWDCTGSSIGCQAGIMQPNSRSGAAVPC
jgi:hypothetical protein